TVADTSGNSSTATESVTVNAAVGTVAPTLTIIGAQTITLPTSAVTISGTASANPGGASIHSVTWSQVSGPNTATLGTPINAWSTAATGLVAGTYVFQMKVVDGLNNSYTLNTNVTVNAAVAQALTTPKIFVAPGEYQAFFIDQNKKLYGVGTSY